MKKREVTARICAAVLAAGLAAVSTLSAFATEVPETDLIIQETDLSTQEADVAVQEGDGQEPGEGKEENNDDLIYVDGVPYSGYYMDSAGILYTVSEGEAEPVNEMVEAETEYYSCDEAGVMTAMTLPSRTLFVEGKVYTGYYLDKADKMYSVKKGTKTLQTGLVKKGTKYYSYNAGKTKKVTKQTLYVKGEVYTGYYLDKADKMYSVKKGTKTLQTGLVKKGTKYYSYNAGKTKKVTKQTLYVKGKVYTGYYLDKANKMYRVKKGTKTLQTGLVKKGTKYYSYNAGKTKKVTKQTLYVKGKVYTGYYLDKANKMYRVKNGRCTLATAMLNTGTKYYSYMEGKTKKLAGQTLYVEGKVYMGYYLGSDNKMYYYANGGTSAPVNTALSAGTKYYNCKANRLLTLSAKTVYVYGKAVTGMSAESLATLERAQAVVASITNESMTKEQKLRTCFEFVKTYQGSWWPRVPHYKGMDWPVVYANDMFLNNGKGNCFSYAAAFAYMARAIGYEEVYCCNSGEHGWAEINGLIYDPERNKFDPSYSYYALSYDAKTNVNHKAGIAAGLPWMHVKI